MSTLDGLHSFNNMHETKNKNMLGVMVGIVTNNQDPDNLARVKVKLPALKPNSGTDIETDWARVVTPMTGTEKGFFFLPEVNDEVLVAFLGGDINCPYILGGLWNQTEKPPLTNSDGKNNIRKIKSRSGNEIILNDEAGKEKVEVKTVGGHSVLLDDENKKVVIKESGGNCTLTIDSNANSVTIVGKSALSLKSDTKVEIVVGGNKIMIESSGIKIESSASVKIKGSQLTAEGSGTAEVKSGGMLTLKGSMTKIN